MVWKRPHNCFRPKVTRARGAPVYARQGRGRGALGAVAAAAAAGAGLWPAAAAADLPPGGGPVRVISNFGRLIAPVGQLSQLEYFPITGAMSPDGRFVWT